MCDTPYNKVVEKPYKQVISLPCGKCLPCRTKTSYQWLFRLERELASSNGAEFVTLTYNDKYLPETEMGYPTLYYPDVQGFFKRLRNYQPKKSKPLKFFLAGEYGTIMHRPHYHLLLFNAEKGTIKKAWEQLNWVTQEYEELGRIDIGKQGVTSASIMYTLNYMYKENRRPKGWIDSAYEFRRMSLGIGEEWIERTDTEVYETGENDYVALNSGKRTILPRYYVKKLFTEEDREHRAERLTTQHNKELEAKRAALTANGIDYMETERHKKLANFVRLNKRYKVRRK